MYLIQAKGFLNERYAGTLAFKYASNSNGTLDLAIYDFLYKIRYLK
jgi:hypothetical protein